MPLLPPKQYLGTKSKKNDTLFMNARTRCDVYLLPRSQFRIWNQRPFSVNRATFQKLEMWARYKSMSLKNEERKEQTMSGIKHGTRGHPKASADLKFRNWEKNALYPACASRKHRLQWRRTIDEPTAFQTFTAGRRADALHPVAYTRHAWRRRPLGEN